MQDIVRYHIIISPHALKGDELSHTPTPLTTVFGAPMFAQSADGGSINLIGAGSSAT